MSLGVYRLQAVLWIGLLGEFHQIHKHASLAGDCIRANRYGDEKPYNSFFGLHRQPIDILGIATVLVSDS